MAGAVSRSQAIIRPAALAECPQVVAVMLAANEEYRPLVPQAVYDAYFADLRALAARWHEVEVAVAEQAGRIVGAVSFYADASGQGWGIPRGWAGFRTLAVHPDARGLGLGRRLAEWCLERSRQIGAPTLCIHTARFQSAARQLYESMGFRRCPEHDFDAAEGLGVAAEVGRVPILAYRVDLDSQGA